MWIEDASPFPFPSSLGALDCRAEDVLSCSREIKGDRASGTMVPVVLSHHCREENWCHGCHPRKQKQRSPNLRGKIKHSYCHKIITSGIYFAVILLSFIIVLNIIKPCRNAILT